MGIRDVSYYGWKDVSFAQLSFTPTAIAVDSERQIYVCGYKTLLSGAVWIIAKSTTGDPNTFTYVDYYYNSLSGTSGSTYPSAMTIGSDDAVYVAGYEVISSANGTKQWITRRSTTGNSGTFTTVDAYATAFGSTHYPIGIASSPVDGAIYVAGYNQDLGGGNWPNNHVRKSSTGASGTFAGVFTSAPADAGNSNFLRAIGVNPVTGVVYTGGTSGHGGYNLRIYSSSAGVSGTWGTAEYVAGGLGNGTYLVGLAFNSTTGANYGTLWTNVGAPSNSTRGTVISSSTGKPGTWSNELIGFSSGRTLVNDLIGSTSPLLGAVGGIAISSLDGRLFVMPQTCGPSGVNPTIFSLASSPNGLSGTFLNIDSYSSSPVWMTERNGRIYICRRDSGNNTVYRTGQLATNSQSLGPMTFATSIGYVQSEISGVLTEKFDLCNISEWSHGGGLYQMKNMILGTVSSGKVGVSEDSIIRVKHIGSTVQIMWPRQENMNSLVTGYGDLSVGQQIGKLTTTMDPGDFMNVTEFDHMSLYCYLQKQSSGTMDDVIIQIERKPLTNIGFTTEQAVSYSTSGSIVEARLSDILYKKQINYGDLSLREIGWPIDIPLTNMKEVRISVRHANGQADEKNSNLIVYGRFIKADGTKTET